MLLSQPPSHCCCQQAFYVYPPAFGAASDFFDTHPSTGGHAAPLLLSLSPTCLHTLHAPPPPAHSAGIRDGPRGTLAAALVDSAGAATAAYARAVALYAQAPRSRSNSGSEAVQQPHLAAALVDLAVCLWLRARAARCRCGPASAAAGLAPLAQARSIGAGLLESAARLLRHATSLDPTSVSRNATHRTTTLTHTTPHAPTACGLGSAGSWHRCAALGHTARACEGGAARWRWWNRRFGTVMG